jgi:hypothetical protein
LFLTLADPAVLTFHTVPRESLAPQLARKELELGDLMGIPGRARILSFGDLTSREAAQPARGQEPPGFRVPRPHCPEPPDSKSPEAAGVPQAPWAGASDITVTPGGSILPYPPARPWSRGAENRGKKERQELPPAPATASGQGGAQPQAPAGCTAYGALGGPNGTWHPAPPADAPPPPGPAPARISAASLAPPSASDVLCACAGW